MRVFITGASGFIGRYVVTELLKKKINVISLSRRKKYFKKRKIVKVFNFDIDKANIDFDKNFNYQIKENDVFLHLAWQGLPNHNSNVHLKKNLKYQKRFLAKVIKKKFKRVIITGTCAEVGKKDGPYHANIKTKPLNCYGKAKDLLRKWLFNKYKNNKNIIWLRIFYVYGDGQHRDSLYSSLKSALKKGKRVYKMSGGDQKRDFIKVEQVAKQICKIITTNKKMNNRIMNICSGRSTKVKIFVKSIIKKSNKKINLFLGYYPYNNKESMDFWGIRTKL